MDKYISELGQLIDKCQRYMNKKALKAIKEYYAYGEYEAALEGMILELSNSRKYPEKFDPEEWKRIARDFELDHETILDKNSWKYFLNWCKEYNPNIT